jgi:hypothetical protein
MDRADVYKAIDRERDHQHANRANLRSEDNDVGGWLTLLRVKLAEAEKAWCKGDTNYRALAGVRDVAAVAVACLEQHGVSNRIG